MFKFFKECAKRHKWQAVHEDGPKRVEAAQWFLQKMQQATTIEEVSFYWGTGSDLLYYQSKNVTDRESKVKLNAIGEEMFKKCKSVGFYATTAKPFELD